MSEQETNSHIFIPKTILKNFSIPDKNNTKSRFVSYIKLPFGKVHYGNIKKFNTEKGGFTSENEIILMNEYETYLGDLVAEINASLKKDGILKSSLFNIDKIKKFFSYQSIRDGDFMYKIAKDTNTEIINDDHYPFIKNQFIQKESEMGIVSKVFKQDALVVMIAPEGGLFGSNYVVNLSHQGENDIIGLSLTPTIFLVLTRNYRMFPALKYTKSAWKIINQSSVAEINNIIFQIGYKRESGIIISKSNDEIKEYYRKFNQNS